jgi:hypothetical protein
MSKIQVDTIVNKDDNGAGPGGPGICIIRYPGTYI